MSSTYPHDKGMYLLAFDDDRVYRMVQTDAYFLNELSIHMLTFLTEQFTPDTYILCILYDHYELDIGVSGKMFRNEPPIITANRELREELGCRVLHDGMTYLGRYTYYWDKRGCEHRLHVDSKSIVPVSMEDMERFDNNRGSNSWHHYKPSCPRRVRLLATSEEPLVDACRMGQGHFSKYRSKDEDEHLTGFAWVRLDELCNMQ